MEFQASDSPAGGTPAVVVTVVFAADAVVEAVETVEEVVLPVVDPGPGIIYSFKNFFYKQHSFSTFLENSFSGFHSINLPNLNLGNDSNVNLSDAIYCFKIKIYWHLKKLLIDRVYQLNCNP